MLRYALLTLLLALSASVCAALPQQSVGDLYFLSLADIHFDPFVACYGVNKHRACPLIQKLRESPPSQWSSILANTDHSKPQFRLDTNYSLLKSGLAAAKAAAKADHAKFIVLLGDTQGHDFRRYYRKYAHDSSPQGYRSFVKKTMQFVALELERTFPTMSIYPVIGNNDTYSRDYSSRVNGNFFQDMATTWAPLIKDEANREALKHSLPYAGYYAVDRQDANLKIIALNSVIFSYKAKGNDIQTAAKRQLQWLHSQLTQANKKHQKVLIIMHIPLGIDVYVTLRTKLFTLIEFWKPDYARAFKDELHQFHHEIVGVLSGHMHSDYFQIISFDDGEEIAVSGTPALSPIFGNNPGFKIYQYSLSNGVISDYYTYYLPLNDSREWGLEYEFNRIYQPNCHLCSLIDGMKRLQLHGKTASAYAKFYVVGKDSKMQPLATHWNPYYWCYTRDSDAKAYKTCIQG